MRKSLMTLAVLGAVAAAAQAQEEPKKPTEQPPAPRPATPPVAEANTLTFEFYGIADLAVLYRNHILNDPTTPSAGQTDYINFISGGRNQSRIGLRGSYQMMPGTRALIQLEKGINYHNGTIEDGPGGDPTQFLNRIAALGIEQEGIGRFTLGRQLTVMYDQVILFDPLGYSPTFSWLPTSGSADPVTGKFNAGRYGTRVDNMIKYGTRVAGFTLGAYYALGDSTTAIGANSKFGGGAIYTLNPLSAVLVYDQRNSTVTNRGLAREQTTVAAAKLALLGGTLTPVFGYRRYVKTQSTTADDLFFGGLTFRPFEKLTLIAADYYDRKRDGTGQHENLLVLRANYAVARIVDVYATYGYASAENGGFAGVIRANDTLPVFDSQTGVSLGLRIRYGYPPASVQ